MIDCLKGCPIPGACCRGFGINIDKDHSDKMVAEKLGQHNMSQMRMIGRTLWGNPILVCDWLDHATGRCRDYDNRPNTCRIFEPGSESLCAAFCGPMSDYSRDVHQKVEDYHERTSL